MTPAPEPLPNDVAVLRAMLAQAWAERDTERAEKAQLAAQNDRLRHLIRQLQRLRFGRRSEKLAPDQLNLALEDVEQAIAETEAQQEKADPAFRRTRAETRRAGRGALPEHLPRAEIVIAPENPTSGRAPRPTHNRVHPLPPPPPAAVAHPPHPNCGGHPPPRRKPPCRTCQEG